MSAIRPALVDAPSGAPDLARSPVTSRPTKVAAFAGAVAMLIVIAGFYFFREHLATGETEWLYVLLLACPLIHLFAHGAHVHGDPAGSPRAERARRGAGAGSTPDDPAENPELRDFPPRFR